MRRLLESQQRYLNYWNHQSETCLASLCRLHERSAFSHRPYWQIWRSMRTIRDTAEDCREGKSWTVHHGACHLFQSTQRRVHLQIQRRKTRWFWYTEVLNAYISLSVLWACCRACAHSSSAAPRPRHAYGDSGLPKVWRRPNDWWVRHSDYSTGAREEISIREMPSVAETYPSWAPPYAPAL